MLMLLVIMILIFMVVMMVVCTINRNAVLIRVFLCMLIVMMVVMMLFLAGQNLCQNLTLQILTTLDGLQNLLAVQLSERSGDDGCLCIMLTNERNRLINFVLRCLIGTGQDNRPCILNLVDKELAEILKINTCLRCIHHSHGAVQLHAGNLSCRLLNRTHYIVQLTYAGGLDDDSLRIVILHYLLQRSIEISDQ